jgi:hypothetical protein
VLIVASAQLILATAVSGWSPNSPATLAAQPRTPSRCSVAVTARRTWSGEGDPEGCRADTNSASARTASNVPGTSYPVSDVFAATIIAVLSPVRLANACCPASRPGSAYVFKASAQTDYRLAGTTTRRQRGRAGVGWVAFVEARLRLNGLRVRLRRAPNRSAGPERGCLREGETLDIAGHTPNPTGNTFGQYGHICAFFNSLDEQHRVLRPFIKDGFDQGDKAYHYVDPELRDEHLGWLAEAGINVPQVTASGQLEVRPWQDSTLRGGRFELDTWLATFEQVLQSGPAAGYAQTSFLGHMEWALADLPGVGDLVEYETRVNYVIPKYEGTVICTYDLTKFGASVVMDALRTHPAVIIGGLLQQNPFFVPPDQLLPEIRERRSARESASTA